MPRMEARLDLDPTEGKAKEADEEARDDAAFTQGLLINISSFNGGNDDRHQRGRGLRMCKACVMW